MNCVENHIHDLTTIDHDVVVYRDTLNFIPDRNSCVKHGSIGNGLYCKNCQTPACLICVEHKEHSLLDVKEEFKSERKRLKEIIHTIKSATLFQISALKAKITADFKTYHTEFRLRPLKILINAKKVNDIIEHVQNKSKFDIIHRCLRQKNKMSIYLASIQSYENIQEQSAMKPIQFLMSKNKHPRNRTLRNHTSKL